MTIFEEVKGWMHRNAREVELRIWEALFEEGKAAAVADALLAYQNEDGGYGHALEADNWNPDSTPPAVCTALKYLRLAGFWDFSHPAYEGIKRFIQSGKCWNGRGWLFGVPGNDSWPRAPWWTYSEEENEKEFAGVNGTLNAFVLRAVRKDDYFYRRSLKAAEELLARLDGQERQADGELEALDDLLEAIEMRGLPGFDTEERRKKLREKIKAAVCTDPARWGEYVKRPSFSLTFLDGSLYEELKEAAEAELDWVLETREPGGVWPICWKWGGMEQYEREFTLSENWWKGMVAIEKMMFLRKFGRV